MNNSTMRSTLAVVLIGALTACGGGGGSGSSLPSVNSPAHSASGQAQQVAISIHIPKATTPSSTSRRPQFISSSTNGAGITVTQGGAPVTSTVDLSAESPVCTTNESGRSCTVDATVVPGSATVAITTYDQAPVSGVIPDGANILGEGSVTQTITSSPDQEIDLFVGGLISSIDEQPAFSSIAADGNSHTFGFVIDPVDFDDNAITAGANDPYANPISVSLGQSGGDNGTHMHLLVNGVDSGSSTTLTQSSQTLALYYDGGSTEGYSATVTLTVPGVGSFDVQISPMFVTQDDATVTRLDLTGPSSNFNLEVTEDGAPESQGYTASAVGDCDGVANVVPIDGSGSSAPLTVQGGTSPSAGGCSLKVRDSDGTCITIPLTNTPLSGSVNIGGVGITEYNVGGTPGPITLGPDGNMWFTLSSALEYISSDGSTTGETSVPGSDLIALTVGSDGALWATDKDNGGVDRVTTAGQVANYPYTMSSCAIITASDGTMWITDHNGNLYNLDVGGLYTFEQSVDGGPTHLVQGPDGAIWFVSDNQIDRFNPADSSFTMTPIPDDDIGHDITVGPDGNIWFTAVGDSSLLGRIAMNGDGPFTITSFDLPDGTDPRGIVGGLDNAVWYTDDSNGGSIGRISTVGSNAVTSYAVPVAGAPQHITLGAEGTLWFTDGSTGNVGHISP